MIGYRRAALCLHGLSHRDCSWVLQSLPDSERIEIGRLLSELKDMGIPRDRSWLPRQINGARRDSDSAMSFDPGMELIAALSDAPVGRVTDLLNGEPDVVIAAVLGCHAWEWADAFVEKLKPMRRPQVLELQSAQWPVRLRNAVFTALLQKYLRTEPAGTGVQPTRLVRRRGKAWHWLPMAGKRLWPR